MKETAIYCRNAIFHAVYAGILKPIFFRRDPESVHDRMIAMGAILGRYAATRSLVGALFGYRNDKLRQNILGIEFGNPIGLSAGFDKNAELTGILPSVGFGFAEVGSVTGEACAGNAKPRLWRMPTSQSILVYYGLKNDGCEAIGDRLKKELTKGPFAIPIGMSVAMTNCAENLVIESAIQDFAKAFRVMEPLGSYITVNVSCPNAQGGQPFVAPDKLDQLFKTLDAIPTMKPVFIKLSPDMARTELDALLDVARRHRIHGIITTNLTKRRDNPAIKDANIPAVGGFGGKVVQAASDEALAYIYKREGKRFVLVGNGGVFTAADAYRKIRLGASLVQLVTGMIYEGPQAISEINRGLVRLLERDGFKNIADAIGADSC